MPLYFGFCAHAQKKADGLEVCTSFQNCGEVCIIFLVFFEAIYVAGQERTHHKHTHKHTNTQTHKHTHTHNDKKINILKLNQIKLN